MNDHPVPPATTSASPIQWPPLPATGFVRGRHATLADFDAGNALFVARTPAGVQLGAPLELEIPQYAFHLSGEKKTPVIVLQAELADGRQMVGAQTLAHEDIVGLLSEFMLLGTAPPPEG